MLLGLAFIAGLLAAVVDAAIQIRSLTKTSQDLVLDGVRAARLSQSMLADISSLDRTARIYERSATPAGSTVIARPISSSRTRAAQLAELLDSDVTRRSLDDFAAMHNEIASARWARHHRTVRRMPRSSTASSGSPNSPTRS
jgi:hypothetical protein